MELKDLVKSLRASGIDVAVEDMLDSFWLARHVEGRLFAQPTSDGLPQEAPAPVRPPPPYAQDAAIPGPDRVAPATDSRPIWPDAREKNGMRRASYGAIPAARALPDRLSFSRALRPFTVRRPSGDWTEMDEERTVDVSATIGFPFPVVRPAQQRWFTVDLVLEDDPAILVWRETLREFFKVLHHSGAFDDVRFWHLESDRRPTKDATSSDFVLVSQGGARTSTKFVAGSGVARLVLLISHGASPHWNDGSYDRLLRSWVGTSSVAIVYLLPKSDHKRAALGEAQGVCSAVKPGLPVLQLDARRFWWTVTDDGGSPFVPLVELDPASIHRFAKMQMGLGGDNPVIFLDRSRIGPSTSGSAELAQGDIERIVSALGARSPGALRLARLLSMAPFTLPVARLIQETVLGAASSPYVLAQVMLSGLVRTTSDAAIRDPERIYFQMRSVARDVLLRSLRKSEAEAAAAELEARVSAHVEKSRDRIDRYTIRYLDDHGQDTVPDFAQAFARVSRALLGDPASADDLRSKVRRFRDKFSPARLRVALDTLRRHRDVPIDPDDIDQEVWRGLLEDDLVRQNSTGEWRLRVGVSDEAVTEPAPVAPAPIKQQQVRLAEFALLLSAEGGLTAPLPDLDRDAAAFSDWLRAMGVPSENIFLLNQPGRERLERTIYDLLQRLRQSIGRRRLYLYFAGHTVQTDQVNLVVGASPRDTVPLPGLLRQIVNADTIDEIISIIDGGGLAYGRRDLLGALGIEPIRVSVKLPDTFTIVAQGGMHRTIAPRSFMSEVLEALRTATVDGYVTTRSVTDRLLKRLSSEVLIEATGESFTIYGPLPDMLPTQGQIRRVWIFSDFVEAEQAIQRAAGPPRPSGDGFNTFELVHEGTSITATMVHSPSWPDMSRSRAPDAIITIQSAYATESSDLRQVLVATDIQITQNEQIASSPRLIAAARRVADVPPNDRRLAPVVLGTVADFNLQKSTAFRFVAGHSEDTRMLVELRDEFPAAHLLAVYALRDPPNRDLSANRQVASTVALVILQSLLDVPADQQLRLPPTADAFRRADELLRRSVSQVNQAPELVQRQLDTIAKDLSAERRRNDDVWPELHRRLADAYLALASRLKQAQNLSNALQHFNIALDYCIRVEPAPLTEARLRMQIGDVLLLRGELSRNPTDLSAAVTSFEEAASLFRDAHRPEEAASADHRAQTLDRSMVRMSRSRAAAAPKSKAPARKPSPSPKTMAKARSRSKKSVKKAAKKKKK